MGMISLSFFLLGEAPFCFEADDILRVVFVADLGSLRCENFGRNVI